MSRPFIAKFDGHCAACDQPIKAGFRVKYDPDGDLVHATCPRPLTYCPACNLVLPASGVCGVCDDD